MIKLGEKIKSLRKQKNISQEVFANYLGVSFQAVSKWENGNTILVQLCRMAFLTSSRMRRRLNISSFVQSASNSPIFSFATAYVPGVFARRIQSVATSSASAMRMRRFLAEFNVGEMHHRNIRFFRQLSLCKPDFTAQVGNAPADGGGTAVSIHCFSPLRL